MCKHCEPGRGDLTLPLLQDGALDVFIDRSMLGDPFLVIKDRFGGLKISVNHCPMCGRDLREAGLGGD